MSLSLPASSSMGLSRAWSRAHMFPLALFSSAPESRDGIERRPPVDLRGGATINPGGLSNRTENPSTG